MSIHVILEFESREEAVKALGGVEARHIVEWFDDRELSGSPTQAAVEALEREALERRTA